MSSSLLAALGLRPPKAAAPAASTDPDRAAFERAAVIDAQRSYADYLGLRDSAGDAVQIAAALAEAEHDTARWRDEFAGRGAPDQREKMELLADRLILEREEFDALRVRLQALDALIARRDAAKDAGSRSELQRAIETAFADLAP